MFRAKVCNEVQGGVDWGQNDRDCFILYVNEAPCTVFSAFFSFENVQNGVNKEQQQNGISLFLI